MMNHWTINLGISLLIPLAAGMLIVRSLIGSCVPYPLFLALSWGTGLGLVSQWMLVLGILEIPYGRAIIAFPLLIVILVLLFYVLAISKRMPQHKINHLSHPGTVESFRNITWPDKWLVTLGMVFVIYISGFVYWRAFTIPVESWDAIATSSFTAKVFFYDRTLHRLNLPHAAYPLHIPLLEAWIAFNLGRWDNILIKTIFPLTFTAYIAAHFTYLRITTDKRWALGGLCLLCSSNFFVYHATIAYRDFSMMYYNCMAVLLLLMWAKQKNGGLLILSALFSGMTTFIKLEGIGYFIIHACIVLLATITDRSFSLKKKIKENLTFLSTSLLLFVPFYSYKLSLGIINAQSGRTFLDLRWEKLSQNGHFIKDFMGELFSSGNWNLLWFLLLLSLICHPKKIKKSFDILSLLTTLFLFFTLCFFTFIFTFSSTAPMETLFSRIILHFYPLSVLLIILLNYPGPALAKHADDKPIEL